MIYTPLSGKPFDCGWYGDTNVCFIPFNHVNSLNSLDVNCGSLSLTISSGGPVVQINNLSLSIVMELVMGLTGIASNHLE
jgi:hypothetical protein